MESYYLLQNQPGAENTLLGVIAKIKRLSTGILFFLPGNGHRLLGNML